MRLKRSKLRICIVSEEILCSHGQRQVSWPTVATWGRAMQFQPNVTREHLLTIVVWCALLLSVQAAIAKNDAARVQGTVTDMEGTAIGAAAITVKNLDTGALFKTRSDGSGEFTVSTLPAGNYQAGVQVAGFQSQVQKFSLTDSEVRKIHFRLAARSRPIPPANHH